MKVGRNDECPCGNLAKFKSCCDGKVDWERILTVGSGYDLVINQNARGKNKLFGVRVAEILQLNKLPHEGTWLDVKRAITPAAVRQIHEAVALLWPTERDLRRVLNLERGRQNALYVGMYQPEPILRGIARHALYSDTVLVIDPFMHPAAVRDEFNPVLNPEQHRANTLIALRLWFLIGPWVDAGFVKVIRTPGDFDAELARATFDVTAARYDASVELRTIAEQDVAEHRAEMEDYADFAKLSYPDHEIARIVRERNAEISNVEVSALLDEVHKMRDKHPFYVEPARGSGRDRQLLTITSGAAYEMAKIVASLTSAHLVTDIRNRWREIELDREAAGIDPERWSPFAKALASAKLRFLDRADLSAARRLRDEQRLMDLRSFFRRVWRAVSKGDGFDDALGADLAAELQHHVNEADVAWKNIDHDLAKWIGGEAALLTGLFATGHGAIFPTLAAGAVAGAANLTYAALKRKTFKTQYPAAFFLEKS